MVLVPWFRGSMILCSMVPGQGSVVPCFCDSKVLWFHDSMVPWF